MAGEGGVGRLATPLAIPLIPSGRDSALAPQAWGPCSGVRSLVCRGCWLTV